MTQDNGFLHRNKIDKLLSNSSSDISNIIGGAVSSTSSFFASYDSLTKSITKSFKDLEDSATKTNKLLKDTLSLYGNSVGSVGLLMKTNPVDVSSDMPDTKSKSKYMNREQANEMRQVKSEIATSVWFISTILSDEDESDISIKHKKAKLVDKVKAVMSASASKMKSLLGSGLGGMSKLGSKAGSALGNMLGTLTAFIPGIGPVLGAIVGPVFGFGFSVIGKAIPYIAAAYVAVSAISQLLFGDSDEIFNKLKPLVSSMTDYYEKELKAPIEKKVSEIIGWSLINMTIIGKNVATDIGTMVSAGIKGDPIPAGLLGITSILKDVDMGKEGSVGRHIYDALTGIESAIKSHGTKSKSTGSHTSKARSKKQGSGTPTPIPQQAGRFVIPSGATAGPSSGDAPNPNDSSDIYNGVPSTDRLGVTYASYDATTVDNSKPQYDGSFPLSTPGYGDQGIVDVSSIVSSSTELVGDTNSYPTATTDHLNISSVDRASLLNIDLGPQERDLPKILMEAYKDVLGSDYSGVYISSGRRNSDAKRHGSGHAIDVKTRYKDNSQFSIEDREAILAKVKEKLPIWYDVFGHSVGKGWHFHIEFEPERWEIEHPGHTWGGNVGSPPASTPVPIPMAPQPQPQEEEPVIVSFTASQIDKLKKIKAESTQEPSSEWTMMSGVQGVQ